jgi:hypothetical protein
MARVKASASPRTTRKRPVFEDAAAGPTVAAVPTSATADGDGDGFIRRSILDPRPAVRNYANVRRRR